MSSEDIEKELSNKTILYKKDDAGNQTREYHSMDHTSQIIRRNGDHQIGTWHVEDIYGKGVVTYHYIVNGEIEMTCKAAITRNLEDNTRQLRPIQGGCQATELNIQEGNLLNSGERSHSDSGA